MEETRPKAKRGRPGTSAMPPKLAADLTLIKAIKGNGKLLIPRAVKLWVERYEKDPKPAMVELLTMLFEACGAKYHIKEEELLDETETETHVDGVVDDLVKLARKGEVEDYWTNKESKYLKDNLQLLLDHLVRKCQHGPLFDLILFDKCMNYIIALSHTPPRVYRRAATLMGLQLVTSFIAAANTLGAQRETTRRQLDGEKKKRTEGPRMEWLDKRFSVTHEKITVLQQMMLKIFQGLFRHRYRDIDPDIRMSCIESLGVWMLSYPSMFLQNKYLEKALGLMLNDQSAGVRKASVLALQNLYEVDDNVPTLGLFTQKFLSRMIGLTDDIDVSVAVCAIGLVKQLLRHQLVPDDDLSPLYDLLIDEPAEIRHAIGGLVYEHLISQGDGNNFSVHLDRILRILREFSTDPILIFYVIDDVWEHMKAMKDWKCIISMLFDENTLVGELTDEDATNLVLLLSASVKKAVGERIVPEIDDQKPYYSKAQKEVFEHNRQDITLAMMNNYPLLLRKFMADKAKVVSLIQIILYMNLELYSLKRQEQNFKNALQLIKEAFFKHGEKEALRSCIHAISLCSTESHGELKDFARHKFKELQDELIAKLKSAMKEVADDGGDEYSLFVNLKRLYELQLSRPVSNESLFEDIASTLKTYTSRDDDDDEECRMQVVSFLLLNMHMHLSWSVHSVIYSVLASETYVPSLLAERNSLLEKLEYFLDNPGALGGSTHGNQLLASWVCILLSDLWFMFRKENFCSTKLETLGYSPDASILQKFWKLCLQQLNISDETEDDENANNQEYFKETHKNALMTCAARLVTIDTVCKEYLGPEIISQYVMHGTSIALIVGLLITVLINMKDEDLPQFFLEALKKAYHRHTDELSRTSGDESLASKRFAEFEELAARLSGMLVGAARAKNKKKHKSDILKIVNNGIEYALVDAPKNLSFLEGAVLHFVTKLPRADVLDIMKDVQKRVENENTDENPSGWHHYHMFVDSLRDKYVKNEKDGASLKRSRGCPRNRRNIKGKRLFDSGSSEEDNSISTSHDHENAEQDEEEELDEDEDEDMFL